MDPIPQLLRQVQRQSQVRHRHDIDHQRKQMHQSDEDHADEQPRSDPASQREMSQELKHSETTTQLNAKKRDKRKVSNCPSERLMSR